MKLGEDLRESWVLERLGEGGVLLDLCEEVVCQPV